MERALETIERNAQAQARLIEDLLDVSRIVSGKLSIQMRPVTLNSTVQAPSPICAWPPKPKALTCA